MDEGFACIFAEGENYGVARSSPREQQSTGLLRFVFRIPYPTTKNTDTPKGIGIFYGVDNGIRTHDLQSHNLTR